MAAPPLVGRAQAPRTWECPINPGHRFTGTVDAVISYQEHFKKATADDSGKKVGPHRLINRVFDFKPKDPLGDVFFEVDIRAMFAAVNPQPTNFIQVNRISGQFEWRTSKPLGPAAYVLFSRGFGDDRGLHKSSYEIYDGLVPNKGTRTFGDIPVGFIITLIRFMANPATAATDRILGAKLGVEGFIAP